MPAGKTTDKFAKCFTDDIILEYVRLANEFTQDLSSALITPMWTLFAAFAGLWIVIEGLRVITFRTTIEDVAKEFFFVIIAAFLLSGQGPELVNNIYSASLSMMGSAASVALQVGNDTETILTPVNGLVPLGEGMKVLVCTVEGGVKQVFNMGSLIANTASITDPMAWIYALILIIPYFLVLVVYFSLVVISIFRIMMIATLSPFLMLGFGFGWGRNMMKSGLRALISTFMILFGGTAAVAVMMYAVRSLDIGDVTHDDVSQMASITDPKFIVTLAMGWLGTAFMAEATGMTNTITDSSFTNTAAGIITAGAVATGMAVAKNPALHGALRTGSNTLGAIGDLGAKNIGRNDRVNELIQKMKK